MTVNGLKVAAKLWAHHVPTFYVQAFGLPLQPTAGSNEHSTSQRMLLLPLGAFLHLQKALDLLPHQEPCKIHIVEILSQRLAYEMAAEWALALKTTSSDTGARKESMHK